MRKRGAFQLRELIIVVVATCKLIGEARYGARLHANTTYVPRRSLPSEPVIEKEESLSTLISIQSTTI